MLEFFGPVNIDWMGKAKFFVSTSIILLVIGGISLFLHGGPLYGIDFRGGTVVYVRFVEAPKINVIRASLDQGGFHQANIQAIENVARPDIHEVMISLDERELNEQQLDAGRKAIEDALHSSFPAPDTTKPDLNSVATAALEETLVRRVDRKSVV